MSKLLSRRDLNFLLYDVLDSEALTRTQLYGMHDRAAFEGVVEAAFTLAEAVFAPFAAKLDANEPTFDGERVHTIPELHAAIDAFVEGGFTAMAFPEAHGGMQLPFTVATAANLAFSAANGPAQGYAFLTNGAAHLLLAHGSPEQIETYARPMIEGRWFGTMALSEPQAGSSLAEVATKAEPHADGSWRLTGGKMWISGAEHELRENIVNLVLARLPDAPAGVKGISLFIVSKWLPDGTRNGVRLVGLNRKMGNRGTTNTVLSFGAEEPCVGYLVGEPHKGLTYMFHMMNEARIGVGASAAVTAYRGWMEASAYAKERRQGRPLGAKDPNAPPVAIAEHPDVKRMLLAQKAIAEGSLCLCLYCARLVDQLAVEEDAETRADLHTLLELLTPVAKSWPSEKGCEANALAIQVHGGYGYTEDFPVERLYRDQRLNPIHEGTTGVQGLDLLGRKLTMDGGRGVRVFGARVAETVAAAADGPFAREAAALDAALKRLTGIGMRLLGQAASDPARGLGNATLFLGAFGTLVVGWLWLEQVATLRDAPHDSFRVGKEAACRYLFAYELPLAEAAMTTLEGGADLLANTPAEAL